MNPLLTKPLRVLNIAGSLLNEATRTVQVDYVPEGRGDKLATELVDAFDRTMRFTALEANAAAFERMAACRPVLREIAPAMRCVPGMRDNVLLHAGPPVRSLDELGSGMREALIGAALYEGLAVSAADATDKLQNGTILLENTDLHCCAAAGCGVISASTPMFCVCEPVQGIWAYAPLTGAGERTLSDGDSGPEAVAALERTEKEMAPALKKALKHHGDLEVFAPLAEGMQNGDDGCVRLSASALALLRSLLPDLVEVCPDGLLSDLTRFLSDERLYADLLLAGLKCCLLCAGKDGRCTLFRTAGGNGRSLGVCPFGEESGWITRQVSGGFCCGDEMLAELFGLGCAAMPACPAVLQQCRMGQRDALNYMYDRYESATGVMDRFPMASAAGNGSPCAPDYAFMVREGKTLRFAGKNGDRYAVNDTGVYFTLTALKRYVDSNQQD